jgi:flagellar biosynthesis protein FlhF
MRLKSYFAASVEAAMQMAARELGDEAMLVYSRESTPEARYLGRYEVVFALPGETASSGKPSPARPPHPPLPAPPRDQDAAVRVDAGFFEQISREMRELRRALEELRSRSADPAVARLLLDVRPEHAEKQEALRTAARRLSGCGLSPDQIEQLLPRLEQELSLSSRPEGGDRTLLVHLRRILASEIRVDSRLGVQEGGRRVAVLAGPPGSGKTTTLAKLAARHAVLKKRPVHIVSLDHFRIGASESLRTIATILGVSFETLECAGQLEAALREHSGEDLILVDTPGVSPKEWAAVEELAAFLRNNPHVETHLTLSATTKSADLISAVERFKPFGPARLLFTRLDETSDLSSLWQEAQRSALPLSFLADGQQIPEDIHPASIDRILDGLFGETAPQERREITPETELAGV